MMKFIIATNNRNKLAEMRDILSTLDILAVAQGELSYNSEPEETGQTFEDNALIKARALYELSGLPVIADDSGLEVFALGGAPGIYSARYEGIGTDAGRTARLLENMRDIKDGQRGARFVCAIACVMDKGKSFTVRGECYGTILRAAAGGGGFGYDPVFVPDGYGESFAQLPSEVKNRISHRAKALESFKEEYREVWRGMYHHR